VFRMSVRHSSGHFPARCICPDFFAVGVVLSGALGVVWLAVGDGRKALAKVIAPR
jgi:hypothetical protein